jgi:hypothetical protein
MYPNHLDEFDWLDWLLLTPPLVVTVASVIYFIGAAFGMWR